MQQKKTENPSGPGSSFRRLNHIDYLEGIISDISEQVRMDIELRKAIVFGRERQERMRKRANKAKSDFLANISHEIRTPLNGIIGFTEIIMASIDSPEGHLYAGKILDESDNLMTLINQLLDISKIEAKQLQLNKEPFYLRNLLAETISFIRLRARNKGLKLSVQYDDKLPVWHTGGFLSFAADPVESALQCAEIYQSWRDKSQCLP